jgi:hypothetical protein
LPRRWHLCPRVHAARSPSSDGEADRRSRRHRASGGNSGHDDPDAADALDLGPGPETGTSSRVIQRTGPRQAARAGNAGAKPTAAARSTRAPWDAAARSARLPYFGITLSDEGGQGERAHCRRSGVMAALRWSSGASAHIRWIWRTVVSACRSPDHRGSRRPARDRKSPVTPAGW